MASDTFIQEYRTHTINTINTGYPKSTKKGRTAKQQLMTAFEIYNVPYYSTGNYNILAVGPNQDYIKVRWNIKYHRNFIPKNLEYTILQIG